MTSSKPHSFLVVGISLFAIGALLRAGEWVTRLTPQSLDGWSVVGSSAEALSGDAKLTVPAGAQLARAFGATDVKVTLTTQPVIGVAPEQWPVIEVGPAALVFARNGDSGTLVLVAGLADPVTIPVAIALDVDGRCTDPLTLTLACSAEKGGSIALELGDQKLTFPLESPPEVPSGVVASSGSDSPWSFDQFGISVRTTDSDSVNADSAAFRSLPPASEASSARSTASNSSQFRRTGTAKAAGLSNIAPDGSEAKPAKGGVPSSLEIFTPPVVRNSRAAEVRLLVANRKS